MGAWVRRTGRFGVGVAVLTGAVLVVGAGAAAAVTPPDVVPPTQAALDSWPATEAQNFPSLGYEATSTAEFGDLVTLEPGTGRALDAITVGMSSWGCESDATTPAGPCVSTAGATFQHDLTLNVYAVDTTGAVPAPGALLWTRTQTTAVPYRPSTSPECTALGSRGWWSTVAGACYNGYGFAVTFTGASSVTLPEDVIITVAYATEHNGGSAGPGPWNSLNYGLVASAATTVLAAGADVDSDVAFIKPTGGVLHADGDATPANSWGWTPVVRVVTHFDLRVAAVTAPSSVAAGAPASATATVAGTSIPAGAVAVLAAYTSCAADPVFVSAPLPVTAAGVVGPVSFTPTTSGPVHWVATVGDADSALDSSVCGAVTTQVLAAPTADPPTLPVTGAGSSAANLATALAAILLGAAFVAVSRRRAARG